MHRISIFLCVLCVLCVKTFAAEPPIATFSIVAFDPATGELGVAVQSKFFSVGSVVPWAKGGCGGHAVVGEYQIRARWAGVVGQGQIAGRGGEVIDHA